MEDRLAQALADGKITQEQFDAMKDGFSSSWEHRAYRYVIMMMNQREVK